MSYLAQSFDHMAAVSEMIAESAGGMLFIYPTVFFIIARHIIGWKKRKFRMFWHLPGLIIAATVHVYALIIIADSQENLKFTLENTKNITENFSKVSDSLSNVDFNKIINKAEEAVSNFNEMSRKINSGEGTIGKLINDKRMYVNLEAATKELEELLRDLKLNPKRYIHFSIFGKNPEPYSEEMKY